MVQHGREKDWGFASVTVAMLLGGLSLIALMVMHANAAEAKRLDGLSNHLQAYTAAEGALAQLKFEILSARQTGSQIGVIQRLSLQGRTFDVRLSDEAEKLNFASVSLVELKDVALRLSLSEPQKEAFDAIVADAERSVGHEFDRFETFFVSQLTPDQTLCLKEQVTAFTPAIPARATNSERNAALNEGSIVRVQIQSRDAKPVSGLDSTLLYTGRLGDPFDVLAWRRYTGDEIGGRPCARKPQ